MTIKKRGKGIFTALTASAAALLLVLSGAGAATAEDGRANHPLILPGEAGQPITGTVTVHKHEQGETPGTEANGLEQTVTSPEIPGVTFTAAQILNATVAGTTYGIDLKTNDGWLNAAKLVRSADGTWTFDGAPATVTLGTVDGTNFFTQNTGPENGVYQDAVFADIPVGLYLFTETVAPANVTKAAPWVMAVPLTDPDGDAIQDIGPNERWNYNVHVYPKNAITGVTKTVQDADAIKVGDTIDWTVLGDIPLVANPKFDETVEIAVENLKFFAPTAYVIKDDLDIRLTPASPNPVTVSLANGGTVALEASDYNITWADPNPAGAGSEMTLTFTEAGLNKLGLAVSLSAAPQAVQVQVVLNTVVTSLNNTTNPEDPTNGTIGDGLIVNQAELFPNQSAVDSETPILSNEPESRWGDILIEKVDATDAANLLADAEFQVFAVDPAAFPEASPIVINGEDTFTTDSNGEVRISGLRASNWENGAEIVNEADWQYYWLVESKSPEGFELLAAPIRVAVVHDGDTNVYELEIENVPTNANFELPLTGGVGTWFLTLGGVAILATVLVVARNRRNSEVVAE